MVKVQRFPGKKIDVLLDTSFLNSWKDVVKRKNDGKVGHLYEYPDEFFVFLSKMRSMMPRGIE